MFSNELSFLCAFDFFYILLWNQFNRQIKLITNLIEQNILHKYRDR